ncbi:MAG: dihydroxyacetone kinase subunit DhaK [Thermoguttaceae bacterium]
MTMKKFLNDPNNLTVELLEGLALAYPSKVRVMNEKIVLRAKPKDKSKVAIVTLGGAGHEPALSGYVGEGMLDASVVGDIFAAPGGPKVLETIRMFKDYSGVLLVILNHAGDVMNGNMAFDAAVREGIKIKKILTHEDIAAGTAAPIEDRRGLGGCVPLFKVAGAAAEAGKSLDEVVAIANKFNDKMATIAVTMRTATHPQSGQSLATLNDDEMEIGMGQHGEGGGTGPQPIQTADTTAEMMTDRLVAAIGAKSGDQAVLIVNGSGATTLMEMLVVFRRAHQVLAAKGIKVVGSRVEEILTVQEAAGFQLFLATLDAELLKYYNAPSDTPYWTTR